MPPRSALGRVPHGEEDGHSQPGRRPAHATDLSGQRVHAQFHQVHFSRPEFCRDSESPFRMDRGDDMRPVQSR